MSTIAASATPSEKVATIESGVTPLEPGVYALALATLLAAGALAGWLPARRATRVDPARALQPDG